MVAKRLSKYKKTGTSFTQKKVCSFTLFSKGKTVLFRNNQLKTTHYLSSFTPVILLRYYVHGTDVDDRYLNKI